MLNRALLVLISNLTVLVFSCLLDKTSIDQAVRHISYAGLQVSWIVLQIFPGLQRIE